MGVKARARGFEAYIRDHKHRAGAKVYCGYAATAEDAARLYDAKAVEIYGRAAVLNFPTPRWTPRPDPVAEESLADAAHPPVRVAP